MAELLRAPTSDAVRGRSRTIVRTQQPPTRSLPREERESVEAKAYLELRKEREQKAAEAAKKEERSSSIASSTSESEAPEQVSA